MLEIDAMMILSKNGFFGAFYGSNYNCNTAIDSFMSKYPRGNGISSKDTTKIEIYNACLIYKQKSSRTKSYKEKN